MAWVYTLWVALGAWFNGWAGDGPFADFVVLLLGALVLWLIARVRSWIVSRAARIAASEPEPEPRRAPPVTTFVIDPKIANEPRRILGREADLGRLADAFRTGPVVALQARGGVGKTALAAEYARRKCRDGRYGGAWLVSAASDTAAMADFKGLGQVVGLTDIGDQPAAVFRQVTEALAARGGRWLILHDNIDTPDQTGPLNARLLRTDHIDHLVTSRPPDLPSIVRVLPLGELDRDGATRLLAETSGLAPTPELADLADAKLGRLPLALVVAGAQLRAHGQTLDDYVATFERALHDAPQGELYDKTVYVTITQPLALLADPARYRAPVGTDALMLLRLGAFMNPDDFDVGFLVEGAAAVGTRGWIALPEPLHNLARRCAAARRADALAALRGLALIEDTLWEGVPTRRLHRTTQLVLRDCMGADAAEQIGLVGRLGLSQFTSNPQYDAAAAPRYRRLAGHAVAMAPVAEKAAPGDRRAAAGLVNHTSVFLNQATGDLRLVRELRAGNLAASAAAFGEESVDYTSALLNTASVLGQLGEYLEAEELMKQALARIKDNDPSGAYVHNALGDLYRRERRFAEAEIHLLRSLSLVQLLGLARVLLAGSHGNLGALYSDWAVAAPTEAEAPRRSDLALHHNIEGLFHIRAALGDLDVDTAIRHHNLHMGYRVRGAAAPALAHGLRAAAIPVAMARRGLIGEDHPKIAECRAPLALTLTALGREGEIDRLLDDEVAALLGGTARDITPERTAAPGGGGC